MSAPKTRINITRKGHRGADCGQAGFLKVGMVPWRQVWVIRRRASLPAATGAPQEPAAVVRGELRPLKSRSGK